MLSTLKISAKSQQSWRKLYNQLQKLMSGQQKALQAAIANWAFMGLLGIPILVFLDPLNGWKWEPHNEIYLV